MPLEGHNAALDEILHHHLDGEPGLAEHPNALVHCLQLGAFEVAARLTCPLRWGYHGHLQKAIRRPGADEEPLLAEIVHLLRHLGDHVLPKPRDGDVIFTPGGGDAEGDAPERLVRHGVPEGVEAVEEVHRGVDADVRLAEVGEDGEDDYGVWVEMEELDPVRLEDCHEEAGEGRHQTGVEGVKEDGVATRNNIVAASRLHARGAELVGAGGRQVAHLLERRRTDAGFRQRPLDAEPRVAVADVPVCIAALSFWPVVAFLGAMVTGGGSFG